MSTLNKYCLFLTLLINLSGFAQYENLEGYFLFPIEPNQEHQLAGTFGELRGNHFHAGIDIKVNGRIGIPILAAAEGYVSRIKVSHNGYGHAVYIQHPNGYTTVYAHLDAYHGKIAQTVLQKQYKNKSFSVELFPSANQLTVQIGDTIGFSGNSGGSQAPHLHFEIRNNRSEPINPLFVKFKELPDVEAPIITALSIKDLKSNKTYYTQLKDSLSNHSIKEPIYVSSQTGLGIETYDRNNKALNLNGIKRIVAYKNNVKFYEYEINKFGFHESKYIKAHLEYPLYKTKGISAHRCYKTSSNTLKVYTTLENGIITLANNEKVEIRIETFDINQNKASLTITLIQSSTTKTNLSQLPDRKNILATIPKGVTHSYKSDSVFINFSTKSLFEPLNLELNHNADTFDFGTNTDPLKGRITIGLKHNTAPLLRAKTKAYSIGNKTGDLFNEGGIWSGDFLTFKTKSFDKYICLPDTTNPEIQYISYNNTSIKLKVTDNLSGVKSVKATLDGKWLLMIYDKKSGLMKSQSLTNTPLIGDFKLIVTDDVNNTTTFKKTLL